MASKLCMEKRRVRKKNLDDLITVDFFANLV